MFHKECDEMYFHREIKIMVAFPSHSTEDKFHYLLDDPWM